MKYKIGIEGLKNEVRIAVEEGSESINRAENLEVLIEEIEKLAESNPNIEKLDFSLVIAIANKKILGDLDIINPVSDINILIDAVLDVIKDIDIAELETLNELPGSLVSFNTTIVESLKLFISNEKDESFENLFSKVESEVNFGDIECIYDLIHRELDENDMFSIVISKELINLNQVDDEKLQKRQIDIVANKIYNFITESYETFDGRFKRKLKRIMSI